MILILGGTSETHQKAQYLEQNSTPFIISVATNYGFRSFSEVFKDKTIQINFTPETLKKFITDNGISEIFDCTHPYAFVITETAQNVCRAMGIPYHSFIPRHEPGGRLQSHAARP